MEIKGNVIICEPGDEFTIKVREVACVAVAQQQTQQAEGGHESAVAQQQTQQAESGDESAAEQTHDDGRLAFGELLAKFNEVLAWRGYRAVTAGTATYGYLQWAHGFADRLYDGRTAYDGEDWMFSPSCYPLVYDYRGSDGSDDGTAYNAMQSWLMASALAELVPDSGSTTNTQTELFRLAYELGGGRSFPLFNQKTMKADPYAMRDVAGVLYAVCRGDSNISSQIATYRQELGGKAIPASDWNGLGYANQTVSDGEGRRGYQTTSLGYCVNSRMFLPDAPGPRVPGTTVCDLPLPYEQGQPTALFTLQTQNYTMDEIIYNHMVKEWNMMSQTPLPVWQSYSREKQNRLVNVAAIPPCTYNYMFGKPKNVRFDGIRRKSYDGQTTADYFCFSETSEDTGLRLEGPYADLHGIYRYNAPVKNARELFIEAVTLTADNMRWATMDPNYGRSRPGCKVSRQTAERNPVHGAAENEIYNVDLTAMVADDAQQRARMQREDGFAADSPRSYVSGHSAQIWCLALMFCQMRECDMNPGWIRKAYEYSVNRAVGRFHWMSDVIYGRLFGAMTLPIINAMSGLQPGYEATRAFVLNPDPEDTPEPAPQTDWQAKVIVRNLTGRDIQTTGEVRLYVNGHEGVNVYMPGALQVGARATFPAGGEYAYDTVCEGNGFVLDDRYDGKHVESIRIYDQRHWKSEDWEQPVSITVDTADPRTSAAIRKSGATYVLAIRPS